MEPTVAEPHGSGEIAGALLLGAVAAAGFELWRTQVHPSARPAGASSVATPRTLGALPADPAAAALLLQARRLGAAQRAEPRPLDLGVLARDPAGAGFAPAFADLADAYLLAGEAGSLPEAVAFDAADHAAARARQLDPALAAAPRAQGFVAYWWRHDRAAAESAFQDAFRLDSGDAQTRFCYANILADPGDFAAADREFARARLGDPGSEQIGADYAWSLWMRGRNEEALGRLRSLLTARPALAEAQDCLRLILLAAGDCPGALRAYAARATLRRELAILARTETLANAYARGGGKALLAQAFAQEMASQADDPYPDHSEAAFYASLAGDRVALQRALRAADAEGELWGSAGYVRRIRARWAGDPQVMAALNRRATPQRPTDHPG